MEYFAYSQKEFVYKYIVMASDLDQFGHMSFANYLRLMFLASDALFLAALKSNERKQIRIKPFKTGMQFKYQTGYGDEILVKINASNIEKSSFSILYTYVIEGNANLVGLGRQDYKAISVSSGEELKMPDPVLSLLKPIKVDEDFLLYDYK